jgi:hypothetical protein
MVRRVTRDRAHVFVATSVACEAQLVVFSGRVRHDAGGALQTGARMPLRRIGRRLWVGLVQVDLPASVSPGDLISYDLRLHEGSTNRGLHRLGLLGGSRSSVGPQHDPRRAAVPLGYEEGFLPAFVVPPDDPSELRLVHASCRKPHGGADDEPDALQLLDAELRRTTTISISQPDRPQQLILTGDQIYADDVAAGLLQALIEAGKELLGWDEPIPSVNALTEILLDPGWRTRFLSLRGIELKTVPADDAFDYSSCHLIRFAEWVAMYCFVWSDALWAVNSDGDYTLPGPPRGIPLDKVQDLVDVADQLGFITVPRRAAIGLDVALWLDRFRGRTNEQWEKTTKKAVGYASSVCHARRVLANVASYMMFDDHEITDDWYLNRRTRDALQGVAVPSGMPGATGQENQVGPRMLRNGLSAYAIFQHWGNEPSDFQAGRHGGQLLDLWTWSGGARPYPLAQSGAAAPRAADAILGIPGDSVVPPGASPARSDFGRLRFDFAIGFSAHRLIALDTRTWRYFPEGEPFSWASLAPLVPDPPGTAPSEAAAEVTRVAAAWRAAGAAAGEVAMTAFADVLDAVVRMARVEQNQRSQVIDRTRELAVALKDLLDTLPTMRAGHTSLDPTTGLTIRDPDTGEPLFHWEPSLARAIAAVLTVRDPEMMESWNTRPIPELLALVDEMLETFVDLDFGPATTQLTEVFDAVADYVETALLGSAAGAAFAAKRIADNAGEGLYEILRSSTSNTTGRAAVLAAVGLAAQALDDLTRRVGVDRLAATLFGRGANRLGVGLIRQDALPWMLERPLAVEAPSAPVTFLLSPAPVFGNRLAELAQRAAVALSVARGELGEEEYDFEPWTANVPAMGWLFDAVGSGRTVVVLSGDVHYAGSAVADIRKKGAKSRWIQLTASPTRNSDAKTRGIETLDDLAYDANGTIFFEQADWAGLTEQGSSSLAHLRRLARAEVESRLDPFRTWWETPPEFPDLSELLRGPTAEEVTALVRRAATAPFNSARALTAEMAWQMNAAVDGLLRFLNDPAMAIFGDFLTAGPAARAALRQFYRDTGLDPTEGVRFDVHVLWDRRPDRISDQPVLTERYRDNPDDARAIATNSTARRTVGHSNLGFVRVLMDPDEPSAPLGIIHDIRWYPVDDPPTDPAVLPRTDRMITRHVAGFRGRPPDASPRPVAAP